MITIHLTWWWLAWAGGAIYVLGLLAGWAMLRMADDIWWYDRLIVLGWPLIIVWRIICAVLVLGR